LGSELAVVQDHALEGEADRIGRRAATAATPLQAKLAHVHRNRPVIGLGRVSRASGGGSILARGTSPVAQRATYGSGTHGYKKNEQKRLSGKFSTPVSGATHQSEHYYGFAAVNQTSPNNRRASGKYERSLPAYQEVHDSHRAHPGTGSSKQIGPSGFSSETYRDYQRRLLEGENPSAAGQLNSLGYAFVPNFQTDAQTTAGRQAADSFTTMMVGMNSASYMQGSTQVDVPLSVDDKYEQLVARFMATNKRYPNLTELNAIRSQLGMSALTSLPTGW